MAASETQIQVASHLYTEFGASILPNSVRDILSDDSYRCFVACSGGADSVFLLYWAYGYFLANDSLANLEVLHFNHCLRGEESDGDERFVQKLCLGLGIPVYSSRWKRPNPVKSVSEAEARSARFSFFQSICVQAKRSLVLTGHHGGDVVETMLMRLSRGSGSVGLSAPRPISDPGLGFAICRPLLALDGATVCEALSRFEVQWREDRSNVADDFYRNRVRSTVVPAWENASDRKLLPGVLKARERLEEDSIALDSWLDSLWGELLIDDNSIDLGYFLRLELALQRRAVDRLLAQSGERIAFTADHWGILRLSCEKGEDCVISLSDSARLMLDYCKRRISIDIKENVVEWSLFKLPVQGLAYLPDGSCVEARWIELNDDLLASLKAGEYSHTTTVFLKMKHLASLSVRMWRYGDSYRPHGLENGKKVGKLFIDRKVPLDVRYRLPFFISDKGEILWVPHLPPNESFLVDHKTTHALQLTYKAFDVSS